MRITLIATLYFIIGYVSATAQYNAIDDINFESGTDGRSMIITYNIAKGVKKLNHVKVYIQQGTSQHFQELKMVSGAINTVNGSGKKTITWRMFDEMGDKPIVDPVFKIEGEKDKSDKSTLKKTNHKDYEEENINCWFEYSYSTTAPIGFTLGFVKRYGGYARGQFSGNNPSLENSDNKDHIITSDFKDLAYQRTSVTAGPIFRLNKWLYLCGGIGYGQYKSNITSQGDYGSKEIELKKIEGLEVEARAIIRLSFLTFSANFNTIASGKYSGSFRDVSFGLGFLF